MNILPKFSFLFQCIPIFIPKSFFKKHEGVISAFIWNNRTQRICNVFLQRPKGLGGMALPNLNYYYWATNLRILHYWLRADSSHNAPAWLRLEAASCSPCSLAALVYTSNASICREYCKNILVKTTVKPSLSDGAFTLWSNHGIKSFNDLYIEGIFSSFPQIMAKYEIPKSHFFRYLQIRSFVKSVSSLFPSQPATPAIDMLLLPPPISKGAISHGYDKILSLRSNQFSAIKAQWEEDIGEELNQDLWELILLRVHSSSLCAKHGLIQCKLIHRTYWTKVRLSKIYPHIDPVCDRCKLAPASLIHMFWSCPSLQSYWSNIFGTLSEVLGVTLDLNVLLALFGVMPTTVTLQKSKADFAAFLMLLARRLILFRWKSPSPPSFESWIRDALHFSTLHEKWDFR